MSLESKSLKSRILGRTLRNSEGRKQRYKVVWGLPVLSSDAISSVAYAAEEILIVLIPTVGLLAYKPLLGITGGIIVLLFILVVCYRQVIDAYPHGGGSYSVAKENLGKTPALIAASSLVIDYILTIAVSACAGTAAITSAFPELLEWKVWLTVAFIILLSLGNLRGIRESSVLFGLPTYFFILCMVLTIVVGTIKVAVFGYTPQASAAQTTTLAGDIGLFLILRAFAAGCSALTGVEAISNSVPNFTEPAQKHAKLALLLLGCLVAIVFGGTSILATLYQVAPGGDASVLSQIAADVFGNSSLPFYLVQFATAIVLLLAANTAYNGLPQLLAILAADKFAPKRFGMRGTRLVFSNGVIFASVVAVILIVTFQANVHRLIPLYSVGVFLSFFIAQTGMVRHWHRSHKANRYRKMAINTIGAIVTGIVCAIVVSEKFTEGAWTVLVLIIAITVFMMRVERHYRLVAENLEVSSNSSDLVFPTSPKNHVIIPIENIDRSFIKAYNYAKGLGGDLEVYHVSSSPAATRSFRKHYDALGLPDPLIEDSTPYRNVNEVLLKHIDGLTSKLDEHETLTIVVPRLVTKRWWHFALHNQTSYFLETALLERRDIAIIGIPYIVDR